MPHMYFQEASFIHCPCLVFGLINSDNLCKRAKGNGPESERRKNTAQPCQDGVYQFVGDFESYYRKSSSLSR